MCNQTIATVLETLPDRDAKRRSLEVNLTCYYVDSMKSLFAGNNIFSDIHTIILLTVFLII